VITLFTIARAIGAGSFLEAVKPDAFGAAGLDKLSADERRRLDALVEAYKNNALAAVARPVDNSDGSSPAVGPQTVQPAPEMPAVNAEDRKSRQRAPAKAKVALMAGTQVEFTGIKSTIPGKFRGWDGRTVFTLANGQCWQVANADSYYTPTRENIEVEIIPARLGGYWMKFPALKTQVRVKLLMDN